MYIMENCLCCDKVLKNFSASDDWTARKYHKKCYNQRKPHLRTYNMLVSMGYSPERTLFMKKLACEL